MHVLSTRYANMVGYHGASKTMSPRVQTFGSSDYRYNKVLLRSLTDELICCSNQLREATSKFHKYAPLYTIHRAVVRSCNVLCDNRS